MLSIQAKINERSFNQICHCSLSSMTRYQESRQWRQQWLSYQLSRYLSITRVAKIDLVTETGGWPRVAGAGVGAGVCTGVGPGQWPDLLSSLYITLVIATLGQFSRSIHTWQMPCLAFSIYIVTCQWSPWNWETESRVCNLNHVKWKLR